MTTAILYVTLSAAAYYLVSRAKITEWAWSRYPPWLDAWAVCAACSGFWYGAIAGVGLGYTLELPLLGLDPLTWYTPLVAGALCMVWTPILAFAMVYGWERLSDDGDAGEDGPERTLMVVDENFYGDDEPPGAA